MAVQWNVHSGTEVFGPWSASRIRDELRSGRIDAFDLVSVAGSMVKRPLVEVDEIFEANAVQAAAIVSEIAEEHSASKAIIHSADIPAPLEEAPRVAVVNERPRAFEALAAPQKVQAPPARHHVRKGFGGDVTNGKDPGKSGRKSYLILIPGAGPRGPFTSKDVLILWYAKQLVAGTYIQRVGDTKRIEISRFASFYERAAPSGMAFIGQASLAHSAKDRSLVWFIFAVLVAIGILTGAIYWRMHRFPLSLSSPIGIRLPFTSHEDEGITGNATIEPPAVALPEKAAVLPEASTKASVPKAAVEAAPVVKQEPPKRVKQIAHRPANKPSVKTSQAVTPQVVSQAVTTVAAPQATHQPVSQSAPASSPKAATPASVAKLTTGWTDGATVTLAGYSFNVSLLNACEMKCKIPMRGPKGPITAVFFKEAVGSGLAAKASNVTITGSVRKDPATGAVSVFVQTFR